MTDLTFSSGRRSQLPGSAAAPPPAGAATGPLGTAAAALQLSAAVFAHSYPSNVLSASKGRPRQVVRILWAQVSLGKWLTFQILRGRQSDSFGWRETDRLTDKATTYSGPKREAPIEIGRGDRNGSSRPQGISPEPQPAEFVAKKTEKRLKQDLTFGRC